ncbi:MAG: hypothetical protein IT290_09870, partial [Deltaproteobacteria bacterium]|nr:hypothetical protein [Deltaproteobacteria bacterium]
GGGGPNPPPPSPTPSPTPGPTPDPTPEPRAADSDGDGISDTDEANLGTNPNDADSDDDGIDDGAELNDGTNPLDRGSFRRALGALSCASWERRTATKTITASLELRNVHSLALNARAISYSGAGKKLSETRCVINPQNGCNMSFTNSVRAAREATGMICVSHDGPQGALLGGLVTREEGRTLQSPLSSGSRGGQSVPLNFSLSLANGARINGVSNRLILSNLSSRALPGRLVLRGAAGAVAKITTLRLAPAASYSLQLTRVGNDRVGSAQWIPDAGVDAVLLRNIRTVTQLVKNRKVFEGVSVVEGGVGSGSAQHVAMDTATGGELLSIANTTDQALNISLIYRDGSQGPIASETLTLAPRATGEIVVASRVGPGKRGSIVIQGASPSSVVAYVTHAITSTPLKVTGFFDLGVMESQGMVLHAGISGAVKGGVKLILMNNSASPISITYDVQRPTTVSAPKGRRVTSGAVFARGVVAEVPAEGSVEVDLSDLSRTSGVVRLESSEPSALNGWLVRSVRGRSHLVSNFAE